MAAGPLPECRDDQAVLAQGAGPDEPADKVVESADDRIAAIPEDPESGVWTFRKWFERRVPPVPVGW
jgi:hypothetical protein